MELKIDLLKQRVIKKSRLRVAFGIFCFLAAISFPITMIILREIITPFYLVFLVIYSVLITINGITNVTEGLGYNYESFLGKAYIIIDSEIISLKATVFEKEQFINWSEVKAIDYKLNKFKIKKTDNSIMIIDLSKFDYIILQEIKKVVSCITKEKNIQSNF